MHSSFTRIPPPPMDDMAAALRDSEERFRCLVESWAQAVWETDADGTLLADSPGWRSLTGQSFEDTKNLGWLDAVHPDHRVEAAQRWQEAVNARTPLNAEYLVRRADGGWQWTNVRAAPLMTPDGTIRKWVGMNIDIGPRKEAEERLARNKGELHRRLSEIEAIYYYAPVGLTLIDRNLRFIRINDALAQINGVPASEHIGRTVWDIVPSLRSAVEPKILRVFETGEVLETEVTGETPKKPGVQRWWLERFYPVKDADGKVYAVGTTVEEITERKRIEEHNALLMAEVNHRTKNLLAVVQSIASLSAKQSEPKVFAQMLRERLISLAASHNLLVTSQWTGVDLSDLIQSQLAPIGSPSNSRITCDGPHVRLSASASQSIGMAMHELLTNAIKYGALSRDSGSIRVTWSIEGSKVEGQRLDLSWTEIGGPPPSAPQRKGFGQTVMKDMVEASLDAQVSVAFPATGFTWQMSAPLDVLTGKSTGSL